MHAAANVALALHRVGRPALISFTAAECNTVGVTMLGGKDLESALGRLESGEADTVVILENDIFGRVKREIAQRLVRAARHIVSLDCLTNETTEAAELVLPTSTFAEASGTFVNNEGRAQRFYQVFVPAGDTEAAWRWLARLLVEPWKSLDDVLASIAQTIPQLAGIKELAPPADFTISGQKIPRKPHRYSGRTAMFANFTVHEPPPPPDPDSPLAFTMEGFEGKPPAPLIQRFWSPGWNSVQSLNKFQDEVGGSLRGGPTGRRLIEPGNQAEYASQIPGGFERRADEWLIVPRYHIFGSDPLSMFTPGVAELAPKAYLAMNPDDALRLGVTEGTNLVLTFNGQQVTLPLKVLAGLPLGLAGLPMGLPGVPIIDLPAWGKISKPDTPQAGRPL